MRSGLVILDATVVKRFEDASTRDLVTRSCRAADWTICPTILNFIEISKSANTVVRSRGFATLRALAPDSHFLPLPSVLLQLAAKALLRGEPSFRAPFVDPFDASLGDDGVPHEHFLDAVRSFTDEWEEVRNSQLRRARVAIQRRLRREHAAAIPTVVEFLDNHWMKEELAGVYARRMWPVDAPDGPPPIDELVESHAWRLFLEADGAAIFERLYPLEEPKRVGFIDVSQLVYLAGSERRILVSDDKALLRVGSTLVHERFPNTRVESWSQFLAHHV